MLRIKNTFSLSLLVLVTILKLQHIFLFMRIGKYSQGLLCLLKKKMFDEQFHVEQLKRHNKE